MLVTFECKSVEHVVWECSEHSSIRKEFIRNLDGILQNDFHLKSSLILIRLNTFLIRVLGNAMVVLIIGFQILRLFCDMELVQRETLSFRLI